MYRDDDDDEPHMPTTTDLLGEDQLCRSNMMQYPSRPPSHYDRVPASPRRGSRERTRDAHMLVILDLGNSLLGNSRDQAYVRLSTLPGDR